jgi:hypothetical protein
VTIERAENCHGSKAVLGATQGAAGPAVVQGYARPANEGAPRICGDHQGPIGRQDSRMLVEVVRLRRDGAKLPPEEVRAAKPLRGLLTIDAVTVGSPRVVSDLARLWRHPDTDDSETVDGLECARVSRVGGDVLLVVGFERRRDNPGHLQAWWCRVIVDANGTTAAAGGTL